MNCKLLDFLILVSNVGFVAFMGGVQTEAKAISENQCGKLSPEKYNQFVQDLTGVHWSFYLLSHMKRSVEENLTRIEASASKTTFLYGSIGRKCPARNSLNNQDDCPVHFVLDHDKDRIPENLVRVKCNCKHCRHERRQFGTSNRCELVYSYTPVWRRNNTDCSYEKTLEYVSVSCTCRTKQLV